MATPGTSLYVNADWSRLVPMNSPEAAFGLTVEEAKRRGLLPAEGETFAPAETIHSANAEPAALEAEPEPEPEAPAEPEVPAEPESEPPAEPAPEPEPEEKEAPKPTNKAARKPRTK